MSKSNLDAATKPSIILRRPRFWLLTAALIVVASVVSLASCRIIANLDSSLEPDFLGRFRGGTLLIAGGGELPPIVKQRFWELAGGKNSRLVIIPAFAATPTEEARLIGEWRPWRFGSVTMLQAGSREIAESNDFADPLRNATSVWFSGGQQSWLANLYADTKIEVQLQELLARGGVIGGTSAGAAIMTRVMIEEGIKEPVVRRGLDLLKDSVVDQHFLHRNRMQRLAKTLKNEPHLIGFGVDEGTALFVQVARGRLGVLGKSYVMACIPDLDSDSLRLEVLKPGDSIDIDGLRGINRTSLIDLESS